MPEYAAMFEVKGLVATSIKVPENGEIDQNFVFKRWPKEVESWIAILRIRTKENEDYSTSKAYSEARKRLRDFVCIHSVFHGLSARTRSVGVIKIKEGEALATTKLKFLIIESSVKYPEKVKAEVAKSEHEALYKSIKVFRENEKSLRSHPYMRNAIDFFYHSDLADRIEERLINLAISLEALYLTEKMELGYRLSLRVALLIGHLYNDRTTKQIAQEVRDLYEKRSSVVHGDPEKITHDEIFRLESYVRRSIQMFLKLSVKQSKREILKSLDDSLFDSKLAESLRG
jgi:hypothetical protein